jgi:hypothetical protein
MADVAFLRIATPAHPVAHIASLRLDLLRAHRREFLASLGAQFPGGFTIISNDTKDSRDPLGIDFGNNADADRINQEAAKILRDIGAPIRTPAEDVVLGDDTNRAAA